MKKVGLLTYHHTTNFGSLLQTYALYKKVQELGYECEVIDYRNEAVEKREFVKKLYQCTSLRQIKNHLKYSKYRKRKAKAFSDFVRLNMKVSEKSYHINNIKEANGKYDCYLVGSDLVWDFTINDSDKTYMLDFADDKTKKVAFASSVGQIWSHEEQNIVKGLLNRFDYIGVREHSIQEKLETITDKQIDFVCDPTMLVTSDSWKKMASTRCISEDYVLVYMSNEGLSIYSDAIEYGKKNNLAVYLISYGWVPQGMKPIRPNCIEEFLSLIMHANTIFSASYHGMLFSLYFNKEFFYYNRGWKERMKSIAEFLQITERETWKSEKDYKSLNYEEINRKLDSFRTQSIHYLSHYLEEQKEE